MPRDIPSWQSGSRDDWVGRESWHIEAINSQGYEKSDNKINIEEMPQKVIESIERNMYFYQQMYMQISTQSKQIFEFTPLVLKIKLYRETSKQYFMIARQVVRLNGNSRLKNK
jgi:hypothetical protein